MVAGMKKSLRLPNGEEQAILDGVQVRLIERAELEKFNRLLDEHHYLGSQQAVGERLQYLALSREGEWLALLVFSAAAKHLKHRDQWIGWSSAQRHRRLSLVTNNSRFLILPERSVPNLATKVLRLTLDRLSLDWQVRYGHPVLVVETFVDPAQFCGTVYSANGWKELGQTDGWGRCRRDYYVKHDQPKRLFCRPLCKNACRSLQAEVLKASLAVVEQKMVPPCTRTTKEIRSMVQHFKAVPDFRPRFESYPLWSLLTIVALATLCGAPRGQKELAKFARGLSQPQRRALGIRRNPQGKYPAPTQPTFCRMLGRVDARKVEQAILAFQEQVRGPAPKDQLVVMDGKEPRHGSGASILSAVTMPGQYYLGSAVVEEKTNEIPVARELFAHLDLEERLVSLDALHTQDETARALVLEHGADYLLTVKGNQPTVREQIEKLIPAPKAGFFPSSTNSDSSLHPGKEQRSSGNSPHY
jgi:Domain of unknown function (DUF4338)/DDE_Tnp_1-associated